MAQGKKKVMLVIELENSKSQYYISLNRQEYTLYPDEEEILLQAGLTAKIKSFNRSENGEWTTFYLYISDKMVS